MSDLAAQAVREVVERHDFFVAWFTGRADEAEMEQSARAFAQDFRRIGPEGRVQDARAVIAMLRGAQRSRAPGFAIRVEVVEARLLGAGLALVLYDEHQAMDGARTARRASAVLSPDASAPLGVSWRHLQETWIDPAAGAPTG